MLHCARKSTSIVLLALGCAIVIAHQLFSQTPVVTTSELFKEIVTILSDANGVHADDAQETLYTVPVKRTLVVTSLIIANDQETYTDVLIKEGTARKLAIIRIPGNSSFCHSFPAGVEWIAESKLNVENLGGAGQTVDGDVHVTINGFLKKPASTTL